MSPHNFVKFAREKLQLDMEDVAERCGLSWYEFRDIESHEDEFFTSLPVGISKCICEALQLDFRQLLKKRYPTKGRETVSFSQVEQTALIVKRRFELGLSEKELEDAVGLKDGVVGKLESGDISLESWPLDQINLLAKALALPLIALVCSESSSKAGLK